VVAPIAVPLPDGRIKLGPGANELSPRVLDANLQRKSKTTGRH